MDHTFGLKLIYGECYQYDQAFTLAIDLVDSYHPVRNMSAGLLKEIVFDAGSTGVVASVADGGTGTITVTDTAHGLLAGEIVYFNNSTDYDGKYVILSKTDDTFTVTAAYTQTRTFNWYQPSTLKIPANGAGVYRVAYNLTADSAVNGKNFKSEISYGGATPLADKDGAASEQLFANGADYSTLSGSGFLTLADGDYVWLQVKDTSDNSDLVIRHSNINITRL